MMTKQNMHLKNNFRLMRHSRAIEFGQMTNGEVLAQIYLKQAPAKSNSNTFIILIFSLFLFVGAGLFQWQWQFVLLLVVALLIHELGHLLAMRICRYKNLKMMFLPFLGALAMGEPDEIDSTKIAIIALAGPLLGLLVSLFCIALAGGSHNPLLTEFVGVSFLLNIFNLLPVVPLDGGVFLRETLFAYFPKLGHLFKAVSLFVLLGYAMWSQTWFLGGFGLVLLFFSPFAYQEDAMALRLGGESGFAQGELDEEKIARIRAELKQINPYFESKKSIKGLPAVVERIWNSVHKKLPRPAMLAALLAIYLAILGFLSVLGLSALQQLKARTASHPSAPVSQEK